MVAYDIAYRGAFHVSFHTGQVVKAFVILCSFGRLVGRNLRNKFGGNACGVHHFVLGIARVYANSLDLQFCRGGIEIFVFNFAHFSTVHGIGPVAAEAFNVEQVCAEAYLLVGIESNAYVAVFYFGMFL